MSTWSNSVEIVGSAAIEELLAGVQALEMDGSTRWTFVLADPLLQGVAFVGEPWLPEPRDWVISVDSDRAPDSGRQQQAEQQAALMVGVVLHDGVDFAEIKHEDAWYVARKADGRIEMTNNESALRGTFAVAVRAELDRSGVEYSVADLGAI